jgi:superfamily II DNA/RNA helicase
LSTTFDALGVSSDLVGALRAQGINHPFPVQTLCIPDALNGRDLCGMAKTGSGKTLAFGLPMLERTGQARVGRPRALVLVPTRELALQVRTVLAPLAALRRLRVQTAYGGTRMDRQLDAFTKRVEIVVATPGRLIDLLERGTISLGDIKMVVLDEADRLADMGFTSQVEWILRRIERPHQTLLFSATLEGDVDHIVQRYLRDPVHHQVAAAGVVVEEMEHRYFAVHQMDKVRVAAAIARQPGKTLIFVRTKRGADRLATQLAREGLGVGPIHGGLSQSQRERQLKRFVEGRAPVLVATDVAARGIHVDGIDVVVHFDPPDDHKAYLHRSGRTARAGGRGTAVTLVLWNQMEDTLRTQRRLGLDEPIVEVFSNDPRLVSLADFAVPIAG